MMNLLKRLWTGIVNKTSVTATPVEVEEVEEDECCGDVFAHLCREAGIKQRTLDSTDLVKIFEDWYDGPCDAESVQNSINEFKANHAVANAKLQGKL